MIDLLKNYRELKNAPGYVGSLRYYLAKKKVDTLFVKWLSSHQQLVEELLGKAKTGKLKTSDFPSPLFSLHKIPINNPNLTMSSVGFGGPSVTPPRASIDERENLRNTMNVANRGEQMMNRSAILGRALQYQVANQIPQFFFPNGKPIDQATENTYKTAITTVIGAGNQINKQLAKKLVVEVMDLPVYFNALLIQRCTNKPNATTMTRAEFIKVWRQLQGESQQWRAFWLLSSQPKKKYLTINDFKQLFKQILNIHPGLQFLKQTPEFQDWYSLCVIHRFFFMANRKYDYKMTFRQYKKSRIHRSLRNIEEQPDINKDGDFFSYQDFYVIYIRFWELDNDHDFQLSRQELSKYSGYTLSRKTLQRIFSQIVRKFEHEEKMGFGDFVWFILCVEDKTTQQSIQFWFKIMDLDGNGVITGYQLEYFYEQQNQRLAYMQSNLDFNFQNIICQMVDVFKPASSIQFTLQDFLKKRMDCSNFFNMLTDLNKLIGYEQRDAYEQRNVKAENPNWTEWDRFVKPEYRRIQSSQQNQDAGDVLNWENDD